jgi:hypothetical protein
VVSTWQVVVLRRSQRGSNNIMTASRATHPVKQVLCGGSCVLRGFLDVRARTARLDSVPQ